MQQTKDPPLAGAYWPTVLLVVLATCPDLVNGTALGLTSATIAASLGTDPTNAQWASIAGNSALALGAALAADFTTRFALRRVFLAMLAVYIAGSAVAAVAPDLPVLIVARIVQGFSSGALLITAVPPLLAKFPEERRPTSIGVLVIGFFGAATAGPLVGGLVEQSETWRWLFALNAALGLLTLPLALAVLPRDPPRDKNLRLDAPVFALATAGVALAYLGVGQLGWHDWTTPEVLYPLVVGLLALALLLMVEALQKEPLSPVKKLATPRAVTGVLVAIVAGIAFTGTAGVLPSLFLENVRGLGPAATGLLFWPAIVAAVVSAVLVGASFGKPWLPGVALVGLALTAAAAWRLTNLTAVTGDGEILLLGALLSLGAGLTITPGLFTAALSVPQEQVSRALSVVTLYRLASAFVATTPLTYIATKETTIHNIDLASRIGLDNPAAQRHLAELAQSLGARVPAPQVRSAALATLARDVRQQALVLALRDVFTLVLWIVVGGTALFAAYLVFEAGAALRKRAG